MSKYEKQINGNFHEILNKLENEIMNSGFSMNLVDESNFSSGDSDIAVRVYDKYFMRNLSRASLSLTVVGHGSDIFISAIGAGGGLGVIFNFSLGAETELVDIVNIA